MSELMKAFVTLIRTEMDKPEYTQEVLKPITRWIFSSVWPYALAIILINFFMTIGAVSLVLYFTTLKTVR